MKPLAIDLFCGLGGWTEGLLAEGYYVVGFDITRHQYGEHCYPAQLVLQDVLTLHGAQFKDAALIVASPPCQAYSYRAMPWKRAKALPPPDNTLFDACFRIQREASEAAGRHVPLVVENVRGAQPWVGRARWNYGSYYLWGDVPALMQMTFKGIKIEKREDIRRGAKVTPRLTNPAEHFKNAGGSWFAVSHNKVPHSRGDEIKCGGDWFGPGEQSGVMRHQSSRSPKRKMASALIAKIPEPLARHIGRVYYPALDVSRDEAHKRERPVRGDRCEARTSTPGQSDSSTTPGERILASQPVPNHLDPQSETPHTSSLGVMPCAS